MTTDTVHVSIDGAARGNPGPAAFAYVIRREGAPDISDKGCLGQKTNNVAEYTALVRALERAAQLKARKLIIQSDSELLVKQMNGEYKVKNKDLQVLYDEAKALCREFESVTLRHVRRAENSHADRLCNEALDGRPSTGAPVKKQPRSGRADGARQEALDCLREAAAAWAHGNASQPPVELVWDQLWSILEENGLLK